MRRAVIPTIYVTTVEGEEHVIEAEVGSSLMEPIRKAGLIEATCGGAASCGTCHLYFPSAEIAGEQKEDEGYMLEALEDFVEVRPSSRLACQVDVTDALEGVECEIAPEA